MTAGVKTVVRAAIRYLRGPTVSSTDLRMLLDALDRVGYARRSLCADLRLQESDLDDPDGIFPCEVYKAIVTRAMAIRRMSNLALHAAANTPIGANPLIDYLVVTSDSVGDGFRQLARYFRVTGPPINIEVRDRESPVRVLVDSPFFDFGAEYTIALAMGHFRRETGSQFAVECVSFSHQPDDVSGYERAFRCPVYADAKWAGIVISREVWMLPMVRRDPVLRGILERHASQVAARKIILAHDIVRELRGVLTVRVVGDDTRMEEIARQLAVTPRTLQRRLADAGTTYQDVLDDVRKEAAVEYVSASTLAIGEIAYMMGYSDRAAFHRAFKRWTGMTPRAFRAKSGAQHGSPQPDALSGSGVEPSGT